MQIIGKNNSKDWAKEISVPGKAVLRCSCVESRMRKSDLIASKYFGKDNKHYRPGYHRM